MSEIQRYEATDPVWHIEPHIGGKFVLHADHLAARAEDQAKIKELEGQVKALHGAINILATTAVETDNHWREQIEGLADKLVEGRDLAPLDRNEMAESLRALLDGQEKCPDCDWEVHRDGDDKSTTPLPCEKHAPVPVIPVGEGEGRCPDCGLCDHCDRGFESVPCTCAVPCSTCNGSGRATPSVPTDTGRAT